MEDLIVELQDHHFTFTRISTALLVQKKTQMSTQAIMIKILNVSLSTLPRRAKPDTLCILTSLEVVLRRLTWAHLWGVYSPNSYAWE